MNSHNASRAAPIRRRFRQAALGTGLAILKDSPLVDPIDDFAASTAAGLASPPYRLECRFLYDAEGSALFELITLQPEYYLTRTEAVLLAENALRIREVTGPVPICELGSGSSTKTDHLLRAWLGKAGAGGRGPEVSYVPIDVSGSALVDACQSISQSHPAVRVIGVNAEYHQAFPLFRDLSPVLVLLLGSSIGNFEEGEMAPFLSDLSGALRAGDFFLLGIDLVKDRAILEAAYNDAAGVTAAFTLNLFARIKRELGAGIDPAGIAHLAFYNDDKERIEIYARFTRRQSIFLAPVGKTFTIERGETIRTEISRKFRLESFVPYLEQFGFRTQEVFTDQRKWYALLLLRRTNGKV